MLVSSEVKWVCKSVDVNGLESNKIQRQCYFSDSMDSCVTPTAVDVGADGL